MRETDVDRGKTIKAGHTRLDEHDGTGKRACPKVKRDARTVLRSRPFSPKESGPQTDNGLSLLTQSG